jgi:hypothetical protein
MPTYRTRVLTARDQQLLAALRGDPRYRRVADAIDPAGASKPAEAPPRAAVPVTPAEPEPPVSAHPEGAAHHPSRRRR